MATIKISALPAVSEADTTDLIPIVQDGITYKETISQLSSALGFNSDTNLLQLSSGGTNADLTPINGGMVYSTDSALAILSTANYAHLVTTNAGIPFMSSTGILLSLFEVTTTAQQMETNVGYIANNSSQVVLTLPVLSATGTRISVQGSGAGGWLIAQNASQIIHVGSSPTTAGVTGSVSSTNRYDSIELVCIVANLEWATLGDPQGTLTIT